jgi:hypothetical protein
MVIPTIIFSWWNKTLFDTWHDKSWTPTPPTFVSPHSDLNKMHSHAANVCCELCRLIRSEFFYVRFGSLSGFRFPILSKWPFLRGPFLLALSRNDGRYKVLCFAISWRTNKRATCLQLDHSYSRANVCAPRSMVDFFKKQSPTNWNSNLGTSF